MPSASDTPLEGPDSLLLELPVPFKRVGDRLLVESQALNGLRLWASHFNPLTVCAPVLPEGHDHAASVYVETDDLLQQNKHIRFVPLPWGYRPVDHFREARVVREIFSELIPRHRYFCFANLGTFGAWSHIALDIARAGQRRYSLWFDWVMHDMPVNETISLKARAKRMVDQTYWRRKTEQAIQHAALGLFHGKTVFDSYAPLCPNPALVHNIHVSPADAISDQELAHKLARMRQGAPLKVGYVGRAHPMKAPGDWLNVAAQVLAELGPGKVEFTWLGDGPLRDDMLKRVQAEGLEASVKFPGQLSDRSQVLQFIRDQDLFLFCHVTPESPRCLIESLISGTPIVGYESAYAKDLVGERGGGRFSALHDWPALARQIVALDEDRPALAALAQVAAASRPHFSDEAVFRHRAELIREYL
jgi:glycosyltransferase involved in cell wall biosynthesis